MLLHFFKLTLKISLPANSLHHYLAIFLFWRQLAIKRCQPLTSISSFRNFLNLNIFAFSDSLLPNFTQPKNTVLTVMAFRWIQPKFLILYEYLYMKKKHFSTICFTFCSVNILHSEPKSTPLRKFFPIMAPSTLQGGFLFHPNVKLFRLYRHLLFLCPLHPFVTKLSVRENLLEFREMFFASLYSNFFCNFSRKFRSLWTEHFPLFYLRCLLHVFSWFWFRIYSSFSSFFDQLGKLFLFLSWFHLVFFVATSVYFFSLWRKRPTLTLFVIIVALLSSS